MAGAAAAVIAAGNAMPAFAQDEDTAQSGGDRVVVTGSRIRTSGFSTPTPVTAVTAEELMQISPGNIVSALVQLPQFFNSSTSSDPAGFFVSPGAGNLNLRGLNADRTLILLNGRRVVSSTRYGGTDISTFPEEMIRSVEAVTGGASAAYGTDAVAGVVNFVLDTDFTGVRAHAQYGITDYWDNENWEAGVSYGTNIGSRGHLLVSGEIFEQEGVYDYTSRDWYEEWGIVSGAAGQPTRLVRPNVRSSVATLDGVIIAPGTPLNRLEFLPDGSTRPFVMGPEGSTAGAYASHTAINGASGTDNNVNPALQPRTRRESYFAYVDYDLTDSLTVFGQGIWGENETRTSNLGGFFVSPFAQLTIYAGNPFLPANIASTMATQNIPSFTFHRVGSDLDTARDRIDITQNTMWSLTGGFDYEIPSSGAWFNGWQAHGYYQRGETSYNAIQRGGVRLDRLGQAVDAVRDGSGNIVCRVNTQPFLAANGGRWSDCVPINLFGRGNASEAALDYLIGFDPGQQVDTVLEYTDTGTTLGLTDSYLTTADKVSSGEIIQNVYELTFDGEIWEGWGAGAISAAFGFHYRDESINQVVRSPANPSNSASGRPVPANDPLLGIRGNVPGNINNSVEIQFSKVPNIRGSLNTTELFGEFLVPVIADQPWMQQLNLNLQARRADYSGSGEIWAWKVGGDAQITDEIRLRATRSRDVRAASLSERFDRTGGFGTVNNWNPPCTDGLGAVVACSIFTVSGGDPNVQPEKADTLTLGVVYQPFWFDGFSISIDWYDIKLKDAIATLTAQQIVDECIAGDQSLCDRIELTAGGQPQLINQTVLNVNEARVTGIDAEAQYQTGVEWFGGGESLGFRLFVGYQSENSRTNFGAAKVENSGNYLFPDLKVTAGVSYSRGPLTVFIQERYTAETNRENFWVEGVDIDDNTVDAVWYTDVNLSYDIERWNGDWTLFFNVNNLLNEEPPVVANFANFGANSQQTLGQFDRLGRRYTVGLRSRF